MSAGRLFPSGLREHLYQNRINYSALVCCWGCHLISWLKRNLPVLCRLCVSGRRLAEKQKMFTMKKLAIQGQSLPHDEIMVDIFCR